MLAPAMGFEPASTAAVNGRLGRKEKPLMPMCGGKTGPRGGCRFIGDSEDGSAEDFESAEFKVSDF
jgi:hypothetical protein